MFSKWFQAQTALAPSSPRHLRAQPPGGLGLAEQRRQPGAGSAHPLRRPDRPPRAQAAGDWWSRACSNTPSSRRILLLRQCSVSVTVEPPLLEVAVGGVRAAAEAEVRAGRPARLHPGEELAAPSGVAGRAGRGSRASGVVSTLPLLKSPYRGSVKPASSGREQRPPSRRGRSSGSGRAGGAAPRRPCRRAPPPAYRSDHSISRRWIRGSRRHAADQLRPEARSPPPRSCALSRVLTPSVSSMLMPSTSQPSSRK